MALHGNPGTPWYLDLSGQKYFCTKPKKGIFSAQSSNISICTDPKENVISMRNLKKLAKSALYNIFQCFAFIFLSALYNIFQCFAYIFMSVLHVTVPDQYFCTKHPDLNITARE